MGKFLRIILWCLLINFSVGHNVVFADKIGDAIVKIFVTSNSMDYYRPWQSMGSMSTTGSGCVISGNRIITNAHVINDNTFIQVRKESDPEKFTAQVEAVGHDCDLAILTVNDKSFFEGITPLEFDELPQLKDAVTVIGFPKGGDKLSITEGVVSRIEIIPYTQSSKKLLAVQIDAAINPGNSGGPVIKDGKIVGIAMQVMTGSQNIGYIIPTPIIKHFLDDLAGDGKYNGFPTLGIEYHNTENKTLREFYKVDDKKGGVLITNVSPYSSSEKIIEAGDVLLEINDIPIGVDGTFEFRENERLDMSYLINEKQVDQEINLNISRNGKIMTKVNKLDSFVGLIPHQNYFQKPPYYIYGGLIFTVLSIDLLQAWGNGWWQRAPVDFLFNVIGEGRLNKNRKKEIVVLLDVLPDDINVGYHYYKNEVINKVNNNEFKSFKEFVLLLENNNKDYTVFETNQGLKIVIKNTDIDNVTKRMLDRNHIPAQYSNDVAGWLSK